MCPDEVEVLPALMRVAEDGREGGFIKPLRLGVAKSAYARLDKKLNSCMQTFHILR